MKIKPNYIILSALSISFLIASPVKAEPLTLAIVGSFLLPILKPIATEVIGDSTKALVAAIQQLTSKKNRCIKCNKLPLCKVQTTFSICKNDCQELVQMGGFELRIRFGEGWNLADCVKKGLSFKSASGKGNLRSIAIYSQEDLDHLKEILGYKVAAEKVVGSQGQAIANEIKTDNPDEKKRLIQRAVNESKRLVQTIDEGIRDEVARGRYGNQ